MSRASATLVARRLAWLRNSPTRLMAGARRRWDLLKYWSVKRRLAGPKLLRAFAADYPEAFFIEVGSNDGTRHDHLRSTILASEWTGIMVEPVPYVFERLRRNYEGLGRITLENLAIADREGPLPFYYLAQVEEADQDEVPGWYDAIGSFSREVVAGHARVIPDVESRIVCVDVPCLTLGSLCRKHEVEQIDLLLTDTEGYDGEILRQIDFSRRPPRLLIYEHYHLAPVERSACRALVEGHGYETMEEGFDTWCLDTRIDDSTTHRWRRLRPGVPGVSVHDEAE